MQMPNFTYVRTDSKQAVLPVKNGTASSGNSVDIQLRSLERHLGSLTLKDVVIGAIEPANICRCAAHVEANHWCPILRIVARSRISYDSSCRTGKNGAQPGEIFPQAKTTVTLHEE